MGFIEFLKNNWFQILTFIITTTLSFLSLCLTFHFNKKNKQSQQELERKTDIYKRFSYVERILNNEFYAQLATFMDEDKINKNHVDKLTKTIKEIRKRLSYLRFENLDVFESLKDILINIQNNAISIFNDLDVKDNRRKMYENGQILIIKINSYLKIK